MKIFSTHLDRVVHVQEVHVRGAERIQLRLRGDLEPQSLPRRARLWVICRGGWTVTWAAMWLGVLMGKLSR